MFFNKNLSINNILILVIAISTVCASSNAMDNHRNLRSYNRSNNTYSNLSNNINNINGKDKYKTSYIILNRDKHDIKVPTYSINRVSNRNYFTIKAQKDNNAHEIFINTRDTNKKVTDIHNYLFKKGGTKRIDETYDNSKKLIKGQYELKTEIKQNNNDIKEFNKNMHNNLINLENHISKLIRNNQNNNNELNKNISNNFLENKKILFNNINQQLKNRNELTEIINDNFSKTNKNIYDSSLQQQEGSRAIIQNINTQTQIITTDVNQKAENVVKQALKTMEQCNNRHEEDFKEHFAREGEMREQFNKEYRDMFNRLDNIRDDIRKDNDKQIQDQKKMSNETIKLLEKTNDAILKNLIDSNEQKKVNQHIKNIQQMLHIVNSNYVQSNVNNKLVEFCFEKMKNEQKKERLNAIQQQNNIIQQQMYNYNNNIINQNSQYYYPYISNYNNQINYNVPNINNQMHNNINIRTNRNNNDEVQFVNGEIIKNGEIISNDNVKEKTSIYDYAINITNNSIKNNNIIKQNKINNDINKVNELNQFKEEDEKEANDNKNSKNLLIQGKNIINNNNNNDLSASRILKNLEEYENNDQNLEFPKNEEDLAKSKSGLPNAYMGSLDLSQNNQLPDANRNEVSNIIINNS